MADTPGAGDYSEEAEKRGRYLLLLLLSDASLSRILDALQEFREAVEGEVGAQ